MLRWNPAVLGKLGGYDGIEFVYHLLGVFTAFLPELGRRTY
jgi:hypothetical protein